jgi:hypothetical protein
VERTRRQLEPIRTLAALADSFARESIHVGPSAGPQAQPCRDRDRSPLEVAYLTRWIELDGGRPLHAWRTICERPG